MRGKKKMEEIMTSLFVGDVLCIPIRDEKDGENKTLLSVVLNIEEGWLRVSSPQEEMVSQVYPDLVRWSDVQATLVNKRREAVYWFSERICVRRREGEQVAEKFRESQSATTLNELLLMVEKQPKNPHVQVEITTTEVVRGNPRKIVH
jgi:hypothetical protein